MPEAKDEHKNKIYKIQNRIGGLRFYELEIFINCIRVLGILQYWYIS